MASPQGGHCTLVPLVVASLCSYSLLKYDAAYREERGQHFHCGNVLLVRQGNGEGQVGTEAQTQHQKDTRKYGGHRALAGVV